MSKKQLLSSLLVNLNQDRNSHSIPSEKVEKKKHLLNAFHKASQGHDRFLVSNLEKLYTYYIEQDSIQVDELIDNLLLKIYNPFDLNTELREKEDNFDQQYGTQTSDIIEQYELPESIVLERIVQASRYLPTPVNTTRMGIEALDKLGIDYGKCVFIDIGSGMGRNLLIASDFPFKKIIGVELSEHLHLIAEKNIGIYYSPAQKCKDLLSLPIDALTIDYPSDEDMVLFFFEPFGENISDQFIKNLYSHLLKTNQRTLLIFVNRAFPVVKKMPQHFKLLDHFYTKDIIVEEECFYISVYDFIVKPD